MRRIRAEIFLPFIFLFINLYTGLKTYANNNPKIIGIMIGFKMKNAKMKIPAISATASHFLMST